MKSIETTRFGTIRFEDGEVIEFPAGLPGFEEEHEFLLVEVEASVPLKFLQSVAQPALSFVCAPIGLVSPRYECALSRGDRDLLAMPAEGAAAGTRLEWLAILCFSRPEAPTANLLGPLVLRRDVGLGVQSIREDARYCAREPLFGASASDDLRREQAVCS